MAKITLTLTDIDITTGEFRYEISAEQDAAEPNLMTGANVAGAFLRSFVQSPEFGQRVWAFAEQIVEQNNDIDPTSLQIINPDRRPEALAA